MYAKWSKELHTYVTGWQTEGLEYVSNKHLEYKAVVEILVQCSCILGFKGKCRFKEFIEIDEKV